MNLRQTLLGYEPVDAIREPEPEFSSDLRSHSADSEEWFTPTVHFTKFAACGRLRSEVRT